MIPKVLHHVWVGPHEMPERYVSWQRDWRRLHPDWEYRLWTDDDLTPELRSVTDLAPVLVCKADVVRAYALLTQGGVYTDVDTQWNRCLDPLLDCRAFAARTRRGHYSNSVYASVPNHETVRWMWERLPEFAPRPPPWGPALLTLAIETVGGFTTIPTEHFFPREWNDPPADISEFPGAYLMHHADCSWRS